MSGVMIPEKLEEAIKAEIEKGNKPFFVNTLSGSTVMGGFDDMNKINEICRKYGLWHHVDACWGGFLVFSQECKKTLFAGIEKVDSIVINPHKGLGVPSQCSVLITNKKPDALRKSNHSGAEYLFHKTEYSQYDLGDKTLLCGRRGDALKLWMCMQRHGVDGFREKAQYCYEKSMYIT